MTIHIVIALKIEGDFNINEPVGRTYVGGNKELTGKLRGLPCGGEYLEMEIEDEDPIRKEPHRLKPVRRAGNPQAVCEVGVGELCVAVQTLLNANIRSHQVHRRI